MSNEMEPVARGHEVEKGQAFADDEELGAETFWTGRYPLYRRVVPIALGGVCIVLSLQLPLGTVTRPGPGLWPMICGILVLVAGALSWTSPPAEDEERMSHRSWVVLIAAGSVGAFIVAMPLIGFEFPMVLLLVLWLKVLGGERWLMTAAVSVGATVAFYLLFVTALGLSLPRLF